MDTICPKCHSVMYLKDTEAFPAAIRARLACLAGHSIFLLLRRPESERTAGLREGHALRDKKCEQCQVPITAPKARRYCAECARRRERDRLRRLELLPS